MTEDYLMQHDLYAF